MQSMEELGEVFATVLMGKNGIEAFYEYKLLFYGFLVARKLRFVLND